MAFSATSLLQPYKDEAESSCPSQIATELSSRYDISPEQNEKLMEVLSPIFGENDLLKMLSQIQGLLDSLTANLDRFTNLSLKKDLAFKNAFQQKQLASARIEQDSLVSQKFPEPEASDTQYAAPTALKDADSSLADNYPNTSGIINEVGDFMKVNKATGDIQIVHHSGTCIKIDNTGNVTIHAIGSLKQVVDGDMVLQVTGGLDISSGKGIYMHAPEMMIKADQKVTIDAMEIEMPNTTSLKASETTIAEIGTVKGLTLVSAPAINIG